MNIPETPETYSLYGTPLYKSPIMLWLPQRTRDYQEKMEELNNSYEKAKIDYLDNQDDPDRLIWFAKKAEILGNFMESTGLYSHGIRKWPDNPQFYRFRGHRFAILRRIDLAIADFRKAAELIEGKPDIPEIDALGPTPETSGVSSFNWNVYYHQGFTYIASLNHQEALKAYRKCMDAVDTFKSKVATSHWLYMVLLRLGKKEEADNLLIDIEPGMKELEVRAYYDTLLMYKGLTTPQELLDRYRTFGDVAFMVPAQAIANMHLADGETEKAVELYIELHNKGNWTGGVHLIAEAELKALGIEL